METASESKLPFYYVLVHKLLSGMFETSVHRKATNADIVLPDDSNSTASHKHSYTAALFSRITTHCCNVKVRNQERNFLHQLFDSNGIYLISSSVPYVTGTINTLILSTATLPPNSVVLGAVNTTINDRAYPHVMGRFESFRMLLSKQTGWTTFFQLHPSVKTVE